MKKSSRHLFGLTCLGSVLACTSKGEDPVATATALREIRMGVANTTAAGVKYSITHTNNAGMAVSAGQCSGLRFATGKIATAKHCLEDSVGVTITFIGNNTGGNALMANVAATGLALHGTKDLAILFFTEPANIGMIGAVPLSQPAPSTFKRSGKATGRKQDTNEGMANEYFESAVVDYKYPNEIAPTAIGAGDIGTVPPILDSGDSGGAFFGLFRTPMMTEVFHPIAANRANFFRCVGPMGGAARAAPMDNLGDWLDVQVPAAAGMNTVEKTVSVFEPYDVMWLNNTPAGAFPATSPIKKWRSPVAAAGSAPGVLSCIREFDSRGDFPVCMAAPTELGANSACVLNQMTHAWTRTIRKVSQDGCNEGMCGNRFIRQVSSCTAECNRKGMMDMRSYFVVGCAPSPTEVCPKNNVNEADSRPARCFCAGAGAAFPVVFNADGSLDLSGWDPDVYGELVMADEVYNGDESALISDDINDALNAPPVVFATPPSAPDPLCPSETCGDTVIDYAEQCDDGNVVSDDGCSSLCLLEACGDNVQQALEECDDGNLIDGDGCSGECEEETCS